MEWVAVMPVWLLCVLIFGLRVADVTLGTMRTVAIVKGHSTPAVLLGFFEVLIWVVAISQVITRLHESGWIALAYAAGFAAGNGVGLAVERRLARGEAVIRILSRSGGVDIARALRRDGYDVTTFTGEGPEGPVALVYAMAPRRATRAMIAAARAVDPDLVYVTEPAHETNGGIQLRLRPVPNPTGWRAVLKKK
ncbi:MAG: DUF5698 domain-containing protein [Thermoanaerobaculales bacterium]|jgi:uncharacterized protein YebE (UPF0316 family)|nr:DUF5698 domain-containing protein [Thermoanaerobaculales bacterium]